MAAEPYKNIANPLEELVNDSKQNVADVQCPKENCRCIILRKAAATLVECDGSKLRLPGNSLPGNALPESNEEEIDETHFWLVKDMMEFENVGFSKTVGTVKYLSCADCDIGPLGYHDTEEPKKFVISIKRAKYKF